MAAADPRRLHAPVGGEVGRPERQPLHPRRRGADRLDVGHAAGGLEDGVDEDRALQPGLGLQLGQQPVDVVDVLGPLDLGDHDHVEAVADLGDGGDEVVERPRRVERVDPRPQLGVGAVRSQARPISTRPARAASLSVAGMASSRLASSTSTVGAIVADLGHHLRVGGGRKWIIRDGRNGISRSGSGAPRASGRKKSSRGSHRPVSVRPAPPRPETGRATRQGRRSSVAVDDHEAVGDEPGDDVAREPGRQPPARR